MKYEACFKNYLRMIEQSLESIFPEDRFFSSVVHQAMRYAVFPGGKRFRPVLTLAACEASGGWIDDALVPASAVELIHSYSLVHDDLPALDNDATRRGKPSCHKQYGEAIAILAGDGLLTLAFQLLAQVPSSQKVKSLLDEISTASGTYGMIGGQAADLVTSPEERTLPVLDFISVHKTGKLIKASAVSGAIAAGASKEVLGMMNRYGECLGLAFQSIDDLLDGDGYASLMKGREIRQKVRDLLARAKREIRPLGRKAEKLQQLADFLLQRMPKGTHVAMDRKN